MPDKPDTQAKARPRRKTRTPEEAARSYFEAISARDADAMAAHWHAEGIDDLVPVGILRGPDEIRRFLAESFGAVPDAETVVEGIVADGRNVVVRWRMTGTFAGGPFQGIEPTGKRIEMRGCDVFRFTEDGKLDTNTIYYDGAEFARQLGMLPPRDSAADRLTLAAFNAKTRLARRLRGSAPPTEAPTRQVSRSSP
jgi:steroid delta-isomerase-like uncharacterized protein